MNIYTPAPSYTPAPEDIPDIISPLPYPFQLPEIGPFRSQRRRLPSETHVQYIPTPPRSNNFRLPPSIVR